MDINAGTITGADLVYNQTTGLINQIELNTINFKDTTKSTTQTVSLTSFEKLTYEI
ncbi:MAG: hypothetical protein ACRCST_05400 [Turicibacter sp.]